MEEEGVHEGISQDWVYPQGVQDPHHVKVPMLGDQVPIEGEGNEVLLVFPEMTIREIR